MKKGIKLTLLGAITVVSGTAVAQASTSFIDEVCAYAPLACSVGTDGNGRGFEPPKPDPKPKEEK